VPAREESPNSITSGGRGTLVQITAREAVFPETEKKPPHCGFLFERGTKVMKRPKREIYWLTGEERKQSGS